jgi:hypothetical protein
VVGFNGADSLMKYLARFTEELLPAEARAAERIEKASTEKAQDATAAKTARASPDARPAVRRE